MSDLLSTGVSGLLAFQRGLATTSQNIANAATEGYSRQRIELDARDPRPFGSGFVGTGVDVTTIRRLLDQFAVNQWRASSSDLGRLSAYSELAGRVDSLLASPDGGLPATLQAFFAAWQEVANNPSSSTARQLLLSQAASVSDRFRATIQRIDQLEVDINGRLAARVAEVNSLATSIARLNADIESSSAAFNGQPPNDLMDERDRLILRLSELVNVTTVADAGGALNVFIGNGQTLVLRNYAASLGTAPSALDAGRLDVVYRSTGLQQVVTQSVTGGEIGGLLDVRREVLDPARQQLGLVAAVLGYAVNAQQAAGMDLNGQLGTALFAVPPPQIAPASTNTGSATAVAGVTDFRALTGDDYVLRFDGAAWSVIRAAGGAAVTVTGSGTAADPLRFEGLSVALGAGAAAGDRYTLRGTRDAAAGLVVALADPRGIAAASPIRSAALAANLGTGTISAGEVVDAADPDLLATVEIRFLTPTTYSINGAGSFAYVPGGDIVVNGWRVQVSGVPLAGDAFRVERNAGGVGDNRNALAIARLQDGLLLGGGTATLGDALIGAVGQVGTQANRAGVALAAQQTIQSSARDAVLSVSGVNLDEEAADLLKWQRAYQAAAQTIAVADTLFQALLTATSRR
jgi:flagellar hook-associated protein 1 FlgK